MTARRLTLCAWTVLFVVSMVVMLWLASHKTIVIADAYQEQTGLAVNVPAGEHGDEDALLTLKTVYSTDGTFSVPLPQNVKAENLSLENHYMDNELRIYIQSKDIHFYEENAIFGNVLPILSACSEVQEDGILLKFEMDRIMEYRTTMEGNTLKIACYEPDELYEYIVVLDPEGGGSDTGCMGQKLSEKELSLQVARLVQKKLTAQDVRLYLTRTEDTEVSKEERSRLPEAVKADFFLSIGAEADAENPENYGICGSYNEEYFIPDFGNVNLADMLTKEVTIALRNRATGLFDVGEESILKQLRTRGAGISLGYLSNPKEEALLAQEAYQEKLADGIVNAITQACETLRKQESE